MNIISKISFFILLTCSLLAKAQLNNEEFEVNSAFVNGKYEECIRLIEKSKYLDKYYTKLIQSYTYTGNLSKTDDVILKLSSNSDKNIAKALVFQTLGQYQNAINLLEPLLSQNSNNYELIKSLGINYWLSGNISKAENYLLSYHSKFMNASSFNNLGLLYINSDTEKALQYFEQGLTMVSNDLLLQISLQNNIGLSHKILKQFKSAENDFNTSLELIKTKLQNTIIHAFVLNSLAEIQKINSEYVLSELSMKNALSILKKNFGNVHPELSITYNSLAELLISMKKVDLAKTYLDSAKLANTLEGKIIDQKIFLESIILKAELFETIYYQKNPKLKYLYQALEMYIKADSLVYEIRKSISLEKDKIALNKNVIKLYDNAIACTFKLTEFPNCRKDIVDIAFKFSEKSKNSVLLQSISETKAQKFSDIPDEVLVKEQEIKNQITYWELNKSSIKNSDIELARLYKKNEDFILELERVYPKYFELKYNIKELEIKDIQKKLNNNELVLYYHVSETNNTIYCFEISKNYIKLRSILKDEKFEKSIISLNNSIKFNNIQLFVKSANLLKKSLLFFKEPNFEKVIIIPDSKISNLPFEVLSFDKYSFKKSEFNDFNYLIKNHSIAYFYSASLYLNNSSVYTEDVKTALLVCPYSYKNGLSTLNGALKEVIVSDSILKEKNINVTSLLKENATETKFKSEISKNYDIVMLSSHGLVNPENPDKSEVFLKEDSKNDGDLFAAELLNCSLNSRLVLLTCCQTGLGKISKGEGLLGLSRALIYSGSKNIIVSLWNVSDSYSYRLISEFQKQMIINKNSISKSLQIAKRLLINEKESSNPFFWAPYILIGE